MNAPTMTAPIASFKRASIESGQVSAILDAAEACFSRSGYAGASMREIAQAAGVSKSLLHYHFQSKEHLFVEAQIRAYERLATRVTSVVAQLDGGAERGLAAFDALFAALHENNELTLQAELCAAAVSNAKLRPHMVRLRDFVRGLFVRSIEEVLGDDAARLPVSVDAAADFLWATINGLGFESALGGPPGRIARTVETLRTLTILSLGPARVSNAISTPHRGANNSTH